MKYPYSSGDGAKSLEIESAITEKNPVINPANRTFLVN